MEHYNIAMFQNTKTILGIMKYSGPGFSKSVDLFLSHCFMVVFKFNAAYFRPKEN